MVLKWGELSESLDEGETQARADGAEPGQWTHFVNLPGDLSVQLRSKTSGPDVLEALSKI